MALNGSGREALRHVERLFGAGTVAGLTERQLLERFRLRRDEAAFEALVAQYGPMVLAACRRVLRDGHAAEDAFQATFLVLARRAGTIRDGQALGPWLYRVALRVSLRARHAQSRRREAGAPEREPAFDPPHPTAEWAPLLHEEVGRLPAKYRDPVVLCYFQGLSHDQAAASLRWPVGTVKGRLARARDLLRSRLARRGLVAAPAALLAAEARASAVAPTLIESTVESAARFAAGAVTAAGSVPAAVALAEGVLRMMAFAKLRTFAAGAVIAGLACLGAGATLVAPADEGPLPAPAQHAAAKPEPEKKAEDPFDSLKGDWFRVRRSGAAEPIPGAPDDRRNLKLRSGYADFRPDSAGEWIIRLNLTLRPDRNPPTIDLRPPTDPNEVQFPPRGLVGTGLVGSLKKVETMRGIYRVEGGGRPRSGLRPGDLSDRLGGPLSLVDDRTLTIRFVYGDDAARPTTLDGPERDGEITLVYRRTPPPDLMAVMEEERQLQGTWMITESEPADRLGPLRATTLRITGRRVYRTGPDNALVSGTFAVDPSHDRDAIDFRFPTDRGPGLVRGLYKREGDRLTICTGFRNPEERPADFAIDGPNGRVVLTFARPFRANPTPAAAQRDRQTERQAAGDMKTWAVARLDAATKRLESQRAFYENGTITIDRYLDAARRVMEARLALADDRAGRLAALRDYDDTTRTILDREQAKFETGAGSRPNLAEAEEAYADARFRLAREQAGQAEPEDARAASVQERTRLIQALLDRPADLPLAAEVPLSDLLRAIAAATEQPGTLPDGLPLFVDALALRRLKGGLDAPVRPGRGSGTLGDQLQKTLEPLGLEYVVRDGLVLIRARVESAGR